MVQLSKHIAVTGAAGNISYSLLFRIANGDMLGKDHPIVLRLLDLPDKQTAMQGIAMELEDCAFPLLQDMIITDDPNIAFKDVDIALLIGAKAREKGMERKHLLRANAEIFALQGKVLNHVAKKDAKVLVAGNPTNTNTYIAMKLAKNLPRKNFTALLRLDHNRALSQLAMKLDESPTEIEKLVVWGNHSPTMYPDFRFATIKGRNIKTLINNDKWNQDIFIPNVAKRGTDIIQKRGLSSAASAANAIIDHMRDWLLGSRGQWITMGVPSDGQYGIPEDLIYGFPVIAKDSDYTVVENLEIDPFSRLKLKAALDELQEEKESIMYLL